MEQNNSDTVTPEVDQIWYRVQTKNSFRIVDVTLNSTVVIEHLSGKEDARAEGSLETFQQAVEDGRLARAE